MRDHTVAAKWLRINGLFLAACVLSLASFSQPANASTAPPHEYYVLSPEPLTGSLSVMSLEANNTINFGGYQLTLQQYERATIPASAFTAGTKFSGSGFFTVGSNENAADLLVPDDFAGTSFVVPHIAGSHRYFLLSPSGTAQVTIRVGASTFNLTANAGVVNEFDAGSDNAVAGRISSDVPIVVTHVSYLSGSARDAYPVAPAAAQLYGIRSQHTLIGALNDGTSVTVYASNGASESFTLDAGEQAPVTVGSGTTQGQGSALHVAANAPIAAVQYDDADGTDATAFWTSSSFGRRHGIPVDAQYLAVACDQASVTLTLYKGANPPETQTCSGSSTTPGKAYFGAGASGANLSAGWYVISSSPVYVMYEASAPEDEHNVLGLIPPAGPAAPTLNSVSSPTTSNPQAISGSAGANQAVRVYVNGLLQGTTTADGSGAYSFNAALLDGMNTLYTTAVASGAESDPSAAVSVEYTNTISRNQSGTISGNVVWTPGNPATPYTITASLTVAAGAKFTLQPGTTLKFANGAVLTATGELKILGTAAAPVVLTSNAATPVRGSWSGVLINGNAGSSIEYATIEYTLTGVNVSGVPATVRNSTIRYFSNNGVYVSGAGSVGAVIERNAIDNLNDTGDCIEANNSSPQIIGNTLTNCDRGVFVTGTAAPTVTGTNVITGNNYGVSVNGSNGVAALPVVTGNQLHANDNYNYHVTNFGSGGSGLKLNANGNWWGATIGISPGIYDLSDSNASALPSVDYAYYLDGPNGSQVPGNYLIGKLNSSTTLLAGTTYEILGVLFVGNGTTLSIEAGAALRFHAATPLIIDGTLTVQGTEAEPVTFTSDKPAPARDDWSGILLRANGSLIEHARIEYMSTGVNVAGVTATVRNNVIRYFEANGVYVSSGAGAAATLIQSNVIDNLNDTGDCIEANGSSPQVIGNTLTNCSRGIYVIGTAAPVINGDNVISGNNMGIYVSGNGGIAALPVATGNQIFANDNYNYQVASFGSGGSGIKLNATGNWWGTANATSISVGIYDLTDSTASALPTVDYANFLDGPGGAPVPGNYLGGRLTVSGSLVAGATYDVLGVLFVNPGVALTIPAGTTVRFHANAPLIVDGTLTIQGTAAQPVTLTSGRATPARDDWIGVQIRANGSLVEHARIEYTATGVNVAGVTATVRNNVIRYFQDNGVYVSAGAGAAATVIQANTIDNLNDTADCIEANGSSPQVIGNTLTNCSRGIYVIGTAAPVINGGNVITGNNVGIYVSGNGGIAALPVATGNQIFANDNYNYQVASFGSGGSGVKLDAAGNWWGSAIPTTISGGIYDLSDSTASALPTVNYADFLEAPNGSAVTGNYLIGRIATSISLTAGATYDVLGVLFVNPGVELVIPAGTTLRFHVNIPLIVDGTLNVQGTAGNLVTFTSARASPAPDNWVGLQLRANGSLIEYALIEYIATGVHTMGVTTAVRNSVIRYFQDNGVYVGAGAGAAGTLIQGNTIDNLSDTADCIEVNVSSPQIVGNTLTNCARGIFVIGAAAPTINGGNLITGNSTGISVSGNGGVTALPVANGNQIYGNTSFNYQVVSFGSGGSGIKLDATGNWWGSADPAAISAGISDLTDNYTSSLPTVNYSGFLGSPNGSPVPGNYVIGPFAEAAATLSAGTVYDVLGTAFVSTGKTLTIEAGAVLRFHAPVFRLVVDGSLLVQGTASSRVRFTSGRPDPGKGSWYGIEVRATASGVVIDNAVVEWAQRAVSVTGTDATISNSLIQNFSDSGIRMTNTTSASQISGNYIDNYDSTGYGIYLSAASPAISGNQIYRTSIGIFAIGASNPTITGNAISSNGRGIVLDGNNSNSATAVPAPVITGNDIFGNAGAQLEIYRYGTSNPVVIDATSNWWGTDTPQNGQHIRFTGNSPASTLDFTNPATASLVGPVGGNIVLSEYHFSPNGDAVKESTVVSGTLSQSASWTVVVRNAAYSAVRTFSGSGTSVSAVWDGLDSGGALLPDAAYTIEVTATGAAGAGVIGSRTVVVDTAAPTTIITSPTIGALIENSIVMPVVGTAADSYLVNYTLQYGAGSSPSTWTTLTSQAAGITQGTLGNWTVGSNTGAAVLANGDYVLRLMTSDRAGNAGLVDVPVTLDLLSISAVTQSLQLMKPLLGEQLRVDFTLSMPASVALRIYPESGGALIKEITQTFSSAGAKSLVWDGRTTAGAYVPDEGYSYALFATSGARTASYDPPAPSNPIGSGTGTVDSSFNANKNDFWKMSYTMNHFGRIRMQVSGCTSPTHYPHNWVPYPPGVHPLIWDGRGAAGQLVTGTCNIYFDAPLRMKANSVIVRGTAPVIMGSGASPGIEVKSNPYRITHSYEHISSITYRIDQDSYVTVKLLPPGISDPASPEAIVLVDNVLHAAQSSGQAVDHVVEWKGYEDLDTNDILVGPEGSYTFAIQATSVASGATSLYRGVLQLWQ